MNKIIPVTTEQLNELRKFTEKGKKYLASDEAEQVEKEEKKLLVKNFKYYYRHPYLRILTAYSVVFLNFYIFAEDPISHSVTDCHIDVIGNIYSFIFMKYAKDGFSALKVCLWLLAIILGLTLGKYLLHKWLLCGKLKIKLFTEDGQGSWMVMFFSTLLSLYLMSLLYNVLLDKAGKTDLKVNSNLHVENQTFMKIAAICTWLGDFITAWMVSDMMLQEKNYPGWMRRPRIWWCQGYHRIMVFWAIAVGITLAVVTAITTDYLNWDRINRDFVATNELSRAFLASTILIFDLIIVMQDWDFPHFAGALDVKLPGLNSRNLGFQICPCCTCCAQQNRVSITGKWFNYGILMMVMILDLNMWKSQIFYAPFDYGQYTDNQGYIYTVTDKVFLMTANKTSLSYAWRWSNAIPGSNGTLLGTVDHKTTAKYFGYSMRVKALAFVPSLFAFCLFFCFVYHYGKEENPEEKMARKWRESNFKKRKTRPRTKRSTRVDIENELYTITKPGSANDKTFTEDGQREETSENQGNKLEENNFREVSNESRAEESSGFSYYFKHPNSRLITAYLAVFLSWLIFAQDPIAYSCADCHVDVIGQAYSFIFLRYPNDSYSALKVLFWITALITGLIIGKYLIHKILLCKLARLKIFTLDGEGSWVIMFLTSLVFLYLWSFLYNAVMKAVGHDNYTVTSFMEMKFETFMKGAAVTGWLGHFLTAWMITDVMLQQENYPNWAKDLRYFWRNGKIRIVVFWITAVGTASVAVTAVCLDFLKWKTMNKGIVSSNEVSRSFLAAFIIVCDLIIIMQDWQFPHFSDVSKFKLPGINNTKIKFKLRRTNIEATGKWICYGIIIFTMVIDVWNWKNQIFYEPFSYGQYIDGENIIYSIVDTEYIRNANKTSISYQSRITNYHSVFKTNTKYFDDNLAEKSAAFFPALVTFFIFIFHAIKSKKISFSQNY